MRPGISVESGRRYRAVVRRLRCDRRDRRLPRVARGRTARRALIGDQADAPGKRTTSGECEEPRSLGRSARARVAKRSQHARRGNQAARQSELPEELEAVESRPVLDDGAVAQAAERDALKTYAPAAVRPCDQEPCRYSIAFGDLVDDFEGEVVQQR